MKNIITIDGPSGAGKSTISKLLAQKLGYKYLDTGALYRAVAWKIKEENGDPEDEKNLGNIIENIKITLNDDKVMVNGIDVTSKIRTPEIGELSSQVSALPIVREFLYTIQKEIGLKGNIVIEGRDIGSTIFQEAEHKFFLDASAEERGRRRLQELKQKNIEADLETTVKDIKTRDKRDSTRQASPLTRTKDMNYIDTTTLTLEEVVTKIMETLKTP
jgi:cytidylate kinase